MDNALRKLVDRAEIDDLITNYAVGSDNPDVELFLSVFASDARVEWDGLDPIIGRDALRQALYDGTFKAVTQCDLEFGLHGMVNRSIKVDGSDNATGLVHCFAVLTGRRNGEPYSAIHGILYEDRYRRIDGRWSITFRRHTQRWLIEGKPSPLPAGSRLAGDKSAHPFA